jgi:DNA-binding XRE family transcriptional regulator
MYFCKNISSPYNSNVFNAMLLSEKLKELREQAGLPQRKVAAALDIDTATYCKIENGKYIPNKEQVLQLCEILSANQQELLNIWLANKVYDVVKNEDNAEEAIDIAKKEMGEL